VKESQSPPGDRNFDDLAPRFKRNVYDRLKGDIRLAVLKRDLQEHIPALVVDEAEDPGAPGIRLLDAGGGQGQLAVELARAGYAVDLCDISSNMLELARENARQAGVETINFIHDSIQNVVASKVGFYHVVLCHAVLEWVEEPEALLKALAGALCPGGYLSVTFYNINSIKMKNLLRTNFRKVIDDDYKGYRGSLTPTYPRDAADVLGWFDSGHPDMTLLGHSGIRCFHDYILEPSHRMVKPEEQLELELRLSTEEPFRSLGRYIHLILRKS